MEFDDIVFDFKWVLKTLLCLPVTLFAFHLNICGCDPIQKKKGAENQATM